MTNDTIERHPSARALVAIVDALQPGDYAAIDADGTLWNGDVGDETMRCGAKNADLWPQKIDADGYFRDHVHDHRRASALSAWAAGLVGGDVLQRAMTEQLDGKIAARRYLVDALIDAVARGVNVVVVSASPVEALPVALAMFGLQGAETIAAQPMSDNTMPAVDSLPVGQGKVTRWRESARPIPKLAIGDSRWDVPLLNFAEHGVLVTPFDDDPDTARSAATLR